MSLEAKEPYQSMALLIFCLWTIIIHYYSSQNVLGVVPMNKETVILLQNAYNLNGQQ